MVLLIVRGTNDEIRQTLSALDDKQHSEDMESLVEAVEELRQLVDARTSRASHSPFSTFSAPTADSDECTTLIYTWGMEAAIRLLACELTFCRAEPTVFSLATSTESNTHTTPSRA